MPAHALEIIAGRAYNGQGQVGVLISHGFGAGWYTWHYNEDLLFDPIIIGMVIDQEDSQKILDYCQRTYGTDSYYGGIDGLEVHWLSPGTEFRIDEYDGAESLVLRENESWFRA